MATTERGGRIYLVSCCSQKAAGPCAAKDLYISDWFTKARRYVESTGCEWRILSALRGLLHPEVEMSDYDFTFDASDPNDRIRRQTWSRTVVACLGMDWNKGVTEVFILAGEAYREFLIPELKRHGYRVEVPMKGLGIGEQKRWLMNQTAAITSPAEMQLDLWGVL